MNLRTYKLTNKQKAKLVKGVTASLSLPIVDSLEDFIWEAIFCYTKGIKLFDPLFAKRSKLLFDVVDTQRNIGWSAKSLQCSVAENVEFELVIQRADIFNPTWLNHSTATPIFGIFYGICIYKLLFINNILTLL